MPLSHSCPRSHGNSAGDAEPDTFPQQPQTAATVIDWHMHRTGIGHLSYRIKVCLHTHPQTSLQSVYAVSNTHTPSCGPELFITVAEHHSEVDLCTDSEWEMEPLLFIRSEWERIRGQEIAPSDVRQTRISRTSSGIVDLHICPQKRREPIFPSGRQTSAPERKQSE